MQVNKINSQIKSKMNFGIGATSGDPIKNSRADLAHGFDCTKNCQECDTFEITSKPDKKNDGKEEEINTYDCPNCERKPQVSFGFIGPNGGGALPAVEKYAKKQTGFLTKAGKAIQNFFNTVKDKAKTIIKK